MSGTVALRHQERSIGSTRPWAGSRLAEAARLTPPTVRHLARSSRDPGPGEVVLPATQANRPLAVVARLWLGVLSIFLLIVFLGLVLIILGAWAVGYRPVVVTSGSMSPVVRTGDVVITKRVGLHDDVGNQTVIDFDDPATSERHLHRVIEVTKHGYRTKGDANQTPDSQLVPQRNVHGAGFILAPFVGYVPIWIDGREWTPLAIGSAMLVGLAFMSKRSWMWGSSKSARPSTAGARA